MKTLEIPSTVEGGSLPRLVGPFGVRCQLGWLHRLTPASEHKATFRNKEFALVLDKRAATAHLHMVKKIAPHLRCRVLPLSRPNEKGQP